MKVLVIGLLAVGLIAGLAVPVMAGTPAKGAENAISCLESDALAACPEVMAAVAEEFEEAPGIKFTLEGGFRGVWGSDDATFPGPAGKLAGVYGKVEKPDGTVFGFFRGMWIADNGVLGGYLKGVCVDGRFRGVWHCLETGMSGKVRGTYLCNDVASVAEGHFAGGWTTNDGQRTGYLKGTWSPLVAVERQGSFGGWWTYNDDLSIAEVAPDGKLSGIYGRIELADGSSMHYFRGRWYSNDGARGRLRGLAFDGRYYGSWNGSDVDARGYVKGVFADNLFNGRWGREGQRIEGRMWGRYAPFRVAQLSEAESTATQTA